jgi:hypothetical protein
MSDVTINRPLSSSGFLTIFTVPRGWRFPKDFRAENYSGMSLCYHVRGSSETDLVLIWWISREAYKTFGPDQVLQDLGVTAVYQTGTLVEDRSKNTHWWQEPGRFIPWAVALLGGFVGVIGNLNQLESLGGWLLASPKAAILVPSVPIKCVQDEERTLEFKVHNTSVGSCTFTDLEAKADGSGVLVVEPKLGPLAPLQSGELRVVNSEILPKSVGKFKIVFSATARAGRLRRSVSLERAVVDLDVWPPFDWKPSVKLEQASGKSAIFLIRANHGRPPAKIVRYQATAESLSLVAAKPGRLVNISPAGARSSVIIWEREAIPLIIQESRLVVSDRNEHSKQEWEQYENQIEVNAEPAFEP